MALSETCHALQDAIEIFQGAVADAKTVVADYTEPPKPIDDAQQALNEIENAIQDELSPHAASAAQSADNDDLNECRKHLAIVHAGLLGIGEIQEERVSTWDMGSALYRVSRQRSEEAKGWADSTRQGLDDVVAPYDRVHRAVYACWAELSESLARPLANKAHAFADSEPSTPHGLDNDVFDKARDGICNTKDALDAASVEFCKVKLFDVVASLESAKSELASQNEYLNSAVAVPEYDLHTFGLQLRSSLAGVASRMTGTAALAADQLQNSQVPEEDWLALACALLEARDKAFAGAVAIDAVLPPRRES